MSDDKHFTPATLAAEVERLENLLETALDELAEWETRATYWYKEATSRGKGEAHAGT